MVKQVRILKDGESYGVTYRKGEIYTVHHTIGIFVCLDAIDYGKIIALAYLENSTYGIECEFIETNNIYELW